MLLNRGSEAFFLPAEGVYNAKNTENSNAAVKSKDGPGRSSAVPAGYYSYYWNCVISHDICSSDEFYQLPANGKKCQFCRSPQLFNDPVGRPFLAGNLPFNYFYCRLFNSPDHTRSYDGPAFEPSHA
jgi:hypothetical protein